MPVFGLGQPQRARQRIDRRSRRADGSPLLEADVPVDADAGEFSHLLAPQAGRAPPRPTGRPTTFGVSFCRRDRRKSPSSLCLEFVPDAACASCPRRGLTVLG